VESGRTTKTGAVLTLLYGGIRHDDGRLLDAQREGDVDELAGPQPRFGVVEGRAQLNGAGAGVDGIVDEGQVARERRRCRRGWSRSPSGGRRP
jgi:hypothetical protein